MLTILKKKFQYVFDRPWIIISLIVVLSLSIRLWHLGAVKEQIFDEVYFITFAKNYLSNTPFFDIHPPLGKLILAIGIKIFNGSEFSWRIMPAIFGTGLIVLGYFTGKELAGKIVGIFTAIIISLDGMFLVYSRAGLIDIFMIFFILFSFYCFLKFANSQKILFLILAGLFLGMAASIKYIAAMVFLTFIVIGIVKKIPFKKYFLHYLLFLIFLPVIVYLSFFIFNFGINKSFFNQVIEWHIQSFKYNLYLTEGHPYGSRWWSWFLLLRPIWLYFKDVNGKYVGIDGIGNPLAWWSSIIVIPLLIWGIYKKKKSNVIILAAFLIFLIPWAFFKRVLFFYHAMPSFMFLSIGISLWLAELWRAKKGKLFVYLYFVILLALFIYFLPIWLAIPIEPALFYHRIWLKGWI
ncbi:MAG: Glycosyl transferase family 39 [Berkelbacteria bacterium GW2011_GWB1_38_5]|uniref:Polyprenol-phosphate-mannose--protein mannosyltransferase n=2 Tax=Candidatus Berkelbacteria TaxID=1618330 RepID=A0A0G0LST3_9BACT|nr:MAG: Glycosyl transferase family 39 [Berkelbacteria bacterium GW2011_GWB1_38_5]KKQ91050.1 MAG: Glycosyl transferase family 39 [Berkelbacteria bacterium GW2011_GWA1_39_10]